MPLVRVSLYVATHLVMPPLPHAPLLVLLQAGGMLLLQAGGIVLVEVYVMV